MVSRRISTMKEDEDHNEEFHDSKEDSWNRRSVTANDLYTAEIIQVKLLTKIANGKDVKVCGISKSVTKLEECVLDIAKDSLHKTNCK